MLESANKMAVRRMELAFVINASLLKLSSQEITKKAEFMREQKSGLIYLQFCMI